MLVFDVRFRCTALDAEGACTGADGTPLYNLFSNGTGWMFKIIWVVIEICVCIGLLNVIMATFVVSATKVNQIVEAEIEMSRPKQLKNAGLLKRLDKLLRTLVHPNRNSISPKDRNVSNVASYIHSNFPDCAANMTDMSKTLMDFAENIQDVLAKHALAMGKYEAEEIEPCKELNTLPCAKMYLTSFPIV